MFNFIKKNYTPILLALILGLALVLRLNGIALDLPSGGGGAAEVNPSNNALRLFEARTLIPDFRVNTHGIVMIYANVLIYLVTFSFAFILGVFSSLAELRDHLILNREVLILISRIFFAFLGTISVYLLYLVSKKLFNKRIGLLSALFFAVNFCFVFSVARKASVWGLMMFFILLALYCAVNVFKEGKTKHYLLSAMFASFAFGTHLVGGIGFIPLLIAHFSRQKKLFSKKAIMHSKLIWAATVFVGFMLIFVALSPTSWTFYMEEGMYQEVTATSGFENAGFGALEPYYYVFVFLFQCMPLVSIFAILGVVNLIRRHRIKELLFITALPIFYYFYIGPFSGFYQARFFSPLIPFIIILSALGVDFVIDKIDKKKLNKIILPLLAIVIIFPSVYFSYLLTLAVRESNVEKAALEWIYKNIPENSSVLIQTNGGQITLNENKEFSKFIKEDVGDSYLSTFKRDYLLNLSDSQYPKPSYFPLNMEIIREDALKEEILKTRKFDYFIANYYIEEKFVLNELFVDLFKNSELLKEFSYRDSKIPRLEDDFVFLIERPVDLLRRKYMGVKIEIYKLNY